MLGGLLGWPQATFASKVVVKGGDGAATVTREVDGGLETVRRAGGRADWGHSQLAEGMLRLATSLLFFACCRSGCSCRP